MVRRPSARLPRGFFASGTACGIKKSGLDLALFLSDRPSTAAALFTVNRFRAAPVLLSAGHMLASRGAARAIVANSGCANAATGREGLEAARRCARAAARLANVPEEHVLVASTGVIGEPLPADRLVAKLPEGFASLAASGLPAAASAIMTTDTLPKTAAAAFTWRGRRATVAGCAKGAGMIHPRMVPPGRHATMLAFLFTDAAVPRGVLARLLAAASSRTFEAISVDGDTSTNDTVFLLANGASGLKVGASDDSFRPFAAALERVAASLARQIVTDGEGARRLLEIEVRGARNRAQACAVAREVGRSPLVKTALAGGDANWGRILSAAGAAGVPFDTRRVELRIGGMIVARGGAGVPYDRRHVEEAFQRKEVPVRILLGDGPGRARFLTCDLTEEYVRINADYRS